MKKHQYKECLLPKKIIIALARETTDNIREVIQLKANRSYQIMKLRCILKSLKVT